jgi:hypothetical protein
MVSSRRLKRAFASMRPTARGWRGLVTLLCLAPVAAMADRFDIVTFDAPPGWSRQATENGLVFETRAAGTDFCQIHLNKSRKQVATLPEELDRTWLALVARLTLIGEPSAATLSSMDNGTTLAQRVGHVRTGGLSYITQLNLFQRDDRLVMAVVNVADLKSLQRCEPAIGEFFASLKLGDATALQVGKQNQVDSQPPTSNPQLAAKFGNSVVGTWRYAFTSVTVTLNAPTQRRSAIEIQFERGGTYKITLRSAVPGGSEIELSEAGTYRSDGQRILMRPRQAGSGPVSYTLDWFFGDHPEHRGNWGLILRSNADWLGGDKDDWRTFKPAE